MISFLATLSIRHAHTDIQVPNFDYYRRKARLDSSKSYRDAGDATSPYSYLTPIGKYYQHKFENSVLKNAFKKTLCIYKILRWKIIIIISYFEYS